MKNYKKSALFVGILVLIACPTFSEELANLQNSTKKFSDNMAHALPFSSTFGLNWSDAYIGKIIDLPPHFGAGISTGFTTLDVDSIVGLLKVFNLKAPDTFTRIDKYFTLPIYAFEGRVGGVILPFDIGFKAGYMPSSLVSKAFDSFNFGYRQTILGADIRYSLINYKLFPVKLSVGFGFNYLWGDLESDITAQSFSFINKNNSSNSINIPASGSKAALEWRTMSTEFKAHFSFPFKFITPYVGAGVSYAWSKAGYKVTTTGLSFGNGNVNSVRDVLSEKYGVTEITDMAFRTANKFNNVNGRAFGGFSLNFVFARLDFTGMYEFIDNNFGASAGLRFQL